MKERLSRLVEQTESLSRQKRHFSEERKSVEKVTDLKIKGLRVKPENEIDSPIKGLDILKYQTPKYESSQGYIGFSVEPVQKINQRNSRKSSPKYDDKRVTETHEC